MTRQNAKKVSHYFHHSKLAMPLIITKVSGKRNPIYLFYEEVEVNEKGEVGEGGDKHYKCYHGNRKTFTITKAMNYSLNGMFLNRSIILKSLGAEILIRLNWSFKEHISAYISAIPRPLYTLP